MLETLEAPTAMAEIPSSLDTIDIMGILPHRYPFLMIDRVTEIIPGKHIRGYKNLSINEPFFEGHFPNNPIVPGVLMIEALAQAGCILVNFMPEGKDKLGLFTGLDNVRFRRPGLPGDRLELHVELLKIRNILGKARGRVTIDGDLACEGEMTFSMMPKDWRPKT